MSLSELDAARMQEQQVSIFIFFISLIDQQNVRRLIYLLL